MSLLIDIPTLWGCRDSVGSFYLRVNLRHKPALSDLAIYSRKARDVSWDSTCTALLS
jgi:hypothetical protein